MDSESVFVFGVVAAVIAVVLIGGLALIRYGTPAEPPPRPELGSTKEVDGFLFQYRRHNNCMRGGHYYSWDHVTKFEADQYCEDLKLEVARRKANS